MPLQPITNADEYRAVLDIVVKAEAEGNDLLARPLRALIDASPFDGCLCNGRSRRHHEPACTVCGGNGFVPAETWVTEAQMAHHIENFARPVPKTELYDISAVQALEGIAPYAPALFQARKIGMEVIIPEAVETTYVLKHGNDGQKVIDFLRGTVTI